jgi:hypothetical protein
MGHKRFFAPRLDAFSNQHATLRLAFVDQTLEVNKCAAKQSKNMSRLRQGPAGQAAETRRHDQGSSTN